MKENGSSGYVLKRKGGKVNIKESKKQSEKLEGNNIIFINIKLSATRCSLKEMRGSRLLNI